MAYFDAAQDRTERAGSADFDVMVEAVRVGTIFAHDAKQHQRWARTRQSRSWTGKPQRGLTGAALEAAVMRVASLFPENVIGGAA